VQPSIAAFGAGKHLAAKVEGKTCFDCHKGIIVHQLQKEYE